MNAMNDSKVEVLNPEELREAARRVLAGRVNRRAGWGEDGTLDTRDLEAEITELGWPLLTVPTAHGGLGQDLLALAPIYEELGRSLSPVSIADMMAAVDVLAADESNSAAEVLEGVAIGEARLLAEFAASQDDSTVSSRFTVRDASRATHLLLLPQSGQSAVLLIRLPDPAVVIERVETWDRGRVFTDITLKGETGQPLTIPVAEATKILRAHSDLAMAWESIGAAQQALTEAVAYMGTRRQFDRPIGSFQALKHRAADLKVNLELARALTLRASQAYATRAAQWSELAGQARVLAVDASRMVAEESVQFHGGIGFTWEHDCHLFLKRALMNEVLGETPVQTRDRIAAGIFKGALASRA